MTVGRSDVRAGLKEIFVEYESRGVDLSTDPRLAEAILLDSFPDAPAEIRALVEAVRSGALQYMRDRAAQGAEFSIGGSASQLVESAGLRDDLARWAAESWWAALSLGALPESRPAPPSAAIPPPPAPGVKAPAQIPPPPPPGSTAPLASSPRLTAPVPTSRAIPPPPAGPPATNQGQVTGTPATQQAPQQAPQQPPNPVSGQAADYSASPGQPSGFGTPYAQSAATSYTNPYGLTATAAGPSGGPKTKVIVGVLVVVLVVVIGVGALLSHKPKNGNAGKSTTTVTTVKNNGSSTTSATPGLDTELEAKIPNSSSCEALTSTELANFAPDAEAAVFCRPLSGGPDVEYAMYSSATLASEEFETTLDHQSSSPVDDGNCNDSNDVVGTYQSESTGTALGKLACYEDSTGEQWLLWIHTSDNILAETGSTTVDKQALLQDFSSFGPS